MNIDAILQRVTFAQPDFYRLPREKQIDLVLALKADFDLLLKQERNHPTLEPFELVGVWHRFLAGIKPLIARIPPTPEPLPYWVPALRRRNGKR